jgi:hypothetical protein
LGEADRLCDCVHHGVAEVEIVLAILDAFGISIGFTTAGF